MRGGFGIYYGNVQALQNFGELRDLALCNVYLIVPFEWVQLLNSDITTRTFASDGNTQTCYATVSPVGQSPPYADGTQAATQRAAQKPNLNPYHRKGLVTNVPRSKV